MSCIEHRACPAITGMDHLTIVRHAKADIDHLSRQAQLVILEGLIQYLYVTPEALKQ